MKRVDQNSDDHDNCGAADISGEQVACDLLLGLAKVGNVTLGVPDHELIKPANSQQEKSWGEEHAYSDCNIRDLGLAISSVGGRGRIVMDPGRQVWGALMDVPGRIAQERLSNERR